MIDADLMVQYRKHLAVQRGVHPETVRRYLRYVASWLTFLSLRGKSLHTATDEDALDWWEQQRASYHDNTAKAVLGAVRNFYAWLANRPNPPRNPFVGYRVRRVWNYVRPYLTEEQVQAILSLPLRSRPSDLRVRALFLFLYSTAARISEALAVNVTDLRPQEHRVILRQTKRSKLRTALLLPEAWEMLALYLHVARPLLAKCVDPSRRRPSDAQALWLGQSGRRWHRESARLAIIRLCECIGLPVPVTPHGIRKSAATHVYRRSHDLLVVKELLGHESLRSTEQYLGFIHDRELERAEQFHPLAGQRVRLRLVTPSNHLASLRDTGTSMN